VNFKTQCSGRFLKVLNTSWGGTDPTQVDVRSACSPEFTSNQAYQDQINVADILVGTKTGETLTGGTR